MKKILAILLSICLLSSLAFLLFLNQKTTWEAQYQVLRMDSSSMEPTIKRGDMLLVEKNVHSALLIAAPKDAPIAGDIIAFYSPHYPGDPVHIIVNRAVDKEQYDGTWYFTTRGDSNFSSDPWQIRQDYIVGKVVETNPSVIVAYWNPLLWLTAAIAVGTGVSSLLIVLLTQRDKTAGRVKCQCGYEYEGKTLPQRWPQCGAEMKKA